MEKQVTAFSIRKDGVEIERTLKEAAKAGKRWEKAGRDAAEGVRVTLPLHALHSDGSEELRGWSRKHISSDWNTPKAREVWS